MSKESKSRDRWRHLGQTRYTDWCPGCGLYAHVNGGHRADCTAQPPHKESVWARVGYGTDQHLLCPRCVTALREFLTPSGEQ